MDWNDMNSFQEWVEQSSARHVGVLFLAVMLTMAVFMEVIR